MNHYYPILDTTNTLFLLTCRVCQNVNKVLIQSNFTAQNSKISKAITNPLWINKYKSVLATDMPLLGDVSDNQISGLFFTKICLRN